MKKGVSIIENTKRKKNSNNTCDIIFNNSDNNSELDIIGDKLTYRQIQYLKGAIRNIQAKKNLHFSNPTEIEEWLKFSILEDKQRQGLLLFVVSLFAVFFCWFD